MSDEEKPDFDPSQPFEPGAAAGAATATAEKPPFDPSQPFEPGEKSLAGFGHNLAQDVEGAATGAAGLVGNLLTKPGETVSNMVVNAPEAIVNEGKRLGAGELLTGHPINAVEKLGSAFYDKPLTTASEVLPLAGGAAKALGLGAEAAEGAEAGAAAGRAAGAAGTAGEEAAAGSGAAGAAGEGAATTPLGQVADHLNGLYGKVAKQPGWSDTMANYLDRWADNMSVKNIGGSVRQVRQMGPDVARQLGRFSSEEGLNEPMVGEIGMEKKIQQGLQDSGTKLGDFRKQADALRDPAKNPIDVLQQVRAQLDPKYLSGRGVNAGDAGSYQKALQEVEDAEASHQGLADVATKLNKYASEEKLRQSPGPFTDVANIVSEANNNHIRDVLGPEQAAAYDQELARYGAFKKIDAMNQFKQARETAGRLGPGGGIRHMAQKFLDEYGYRAGAQVARKVANVLRTNPSAGASLPGVFKAFVNEVEDLLPDHEPEGMAHGGVVDELHGYLTDKYEKKGASK